MRLPEPGPPWPTSSTHVVALIGDPVRHSLSPVLHNAAFRELGLDWCYVAFEVTAADVGDAIAGARALGVAGMNVTMPHKAEVATRCDRLLPTAAALGAVNTVWPEGGRLVGDSTDGPGFLDALRQDEGFEPEGRRCLVVGAGGAGRAVVHALAGAGAAEVVVANRSLAAAESAAALAGDRGRVGSVDEADSCDLVVNATPIGMAGTATISTIHAGAAAEPPPGPDGGGPDGLPVDPERLGPGQLVADLVYHPLATPLVHAARRRGAVACGGLGMLVHQAAHAFRLWTGSEPPVEVMSAAALATLADPQANRG